jgi:uncharacterized membrane protein
MFLRGESGAVAIVTALLMTVLLGFVAFGVSVAHLYFMQRTLQTRADLAAVSAAADISEASQRAGHALSLNGMASDNLDSLSFGRFTANPAMPMDDRYTQHSAHDPGVNAVSVTVIQDAPLSFGTLFSDSETLRLTASASAARVNGVSFTLGSRMARLDAGLLNDLLGAAFGTTLSLDLLDYQQLAGTDIALLPFLEALGTDVGFSAGNYVDILSLQPDLPDIIDALGAGSPPLPRNLLEGIALGAARIPVPLDRIISVSDPDLGVDLLDFMGDTRLSALDLLRATADVINASRTVVLDADLAVPGLLSAETGLRLSERPAASGWVMIGEPGATLHTAQTRLRVNASLDPDLLGSLGVGVQALALTLPVYAELASATAALESLDCRTVASVDVAARFDTGIGVVDPTTGPQVAALYLGAFDPPGFDSSVPLSQSALDFADFLDLALTIEVPLLPDIQIGLLTLQVRSRAEVGQSSTGMISFTHAQVDTAPETETFGSHALLSTAVASLLSSDSLEIRVSPDHENLLSSLVSPLVNAVITLLPERMLSGLLSPIDGALDQLLDGLGTGVGQADLTLVRRHCGMVRLVR